MRGWRATAVRISKLHSTLPHLWQSRAQVWLLSQVAESPFFSLCREIAMNRGVRSIVSCVRSDEWEADAPIHIHMCLAQPFLSRKCGPTNPRLPITPINPNWVRISLATLILLASGALIDSATAQVVCTVAGSTVTLTSGSCQIAPNTTLNGSPAVNAITGAQITTNNVTINPNNGGSIGGSAETSGTITFSSGSRITGNWATAARALTGGQIFFQPGSAINAGPGGGLTALLSVGTNSLISATGLTVSLNGSGGNVAARATNGGTINLISGNSVSFTAGGGGNTGLWAGAGSQISSTGTVLSMPGGGGGDTGVLADASVLANAPPAGGNA